MADSSLLFIIDFKKSGFFSVETILNWSNTQIYKMIIWVKNKLSVMKISVPKLYHDHQRLSGLWIVNLTHIFVTLWICYWCIRPLMCIYDSLWRERSVLLIDTKNIYMYINLWIIILNVYFVQFLLSLKFIWCHSFLLFISFINLILVTYSWVSAHLNRRLKWAVSKLTCFTVISWSKITAFHPNLSHITLRRGQNGS